MAAKTKYKFPAIKSITVDPNLPFGPQVCYLRKNANLSYREVGDRIGWDLSNVCHWEKANSNWRHGNFTGLLLYAKAFNVKNIVMKLTSSVTEAKVKECEATNVKY